MKLYSKHLSTLADLKRERYLMKYAKQVHHLDDLFTMNSAKGKKKKKKKESALDTGNPLGLITSLLGGGAAAGGGLGLLGNKHVRRLFIRRFPKKTAGRLVKEVFFGYLKWKAIELSYGIIAGAIRKGMEKKQARRIADAHHPVHQYSERDYRRAGGPL
jgi:hypothetical protein